MRVGLERLAALLERAGKKVIWRGDRLNFGCPCHDDRTPSASATVGGKVPVVSTCMACAATLPEMLEALGASEVDRDLILGGDLRRNGRPPGRGVHPSTHKRATVQPHGCTLTAYAEAKKLPIEFLRSLGLTDITYAHATAVRIPYRDRTGAVTAARYRIALEGPDRFRSKSSIKTSLYGLDRLTAADYVVLVEGESDCHTLWHHGELALGLPGAAIWKEKEGWADHVDGFAAIYVVIEPGKSGEAMLRWIAQSRIRDRVRLVRLDGAKDPSELHLKSEARFTERWRAALAAAVPFDDEAARLAEDRRAAAWKTCSALATEPNILERFGAMLPVVGLVGEERAAKVVYLAATSRFLPRPVSVALKGPSSAGKSHTMETVLRFMPESAFHALTAMSERALAYSEEPLKHRMLVLYEAPGMSGEVVSYFVRSLLSEGRVRYETVEKTRDGLRPRVIEHEGPTGLLTTTTALRLHPEVETRILSVSIHDTPEQTRSVMLALAEASPGPGDLAEWHALQEFLELGKHQVAVPFAKELAGRVPAAAVRLRRDFGVILNLIRAHALLHQATRGRDAEGRIVATLEDYRAVRELVAEIISDGVQATVPDTVRATVAAVVAIATDTGGVQASNVATYLNLDRSAALRRLRDAADRGYLENLETRRGRPGRWALDEPLPADVPLLPDPLELAGCAVARVAEGDVTPHPSPDVIGLTMAEELGGAIDRLAAEEVES